MKKEICYATFARNEILNLPLWIKHYSKLAQPEDIYIFDQDTIDGSTDNLECNVIKEPHPQGKVFDFDFLRDMILRRQHWLMEQYKIVVFTEADELIITKDNTHLSEYLIRKLENVNTAVEMQIVDVLQGPDEPDFNIDIPISRQRNFWTWTWNGTVPDVARKSTISTLKYTGIVMGFHGPSVQPCIRDDNLIVVHIQSLNISSWFFKIENRNKDAVKYNKKNYYHLDTANILMDEYKQKMYEAPDYFKNHDFI